LFYIQQKKQTGFTSTKFIIIPTNPSTLSFEKKKEIIQSLECRKETKQEKLDHVYCQLLSLKDPLFKMANPIGEKLEQCFILFALHRNCK
jgi:cellulose biosynthesis protein BcsQ